MTHLRSTPTVLCALLLALALAACGQTGTASTPTEQATSAPVGPTTVAPEARSSDPGSRTLPFAEPIGGITVETDPLRGLPVTTSQPTYVDPLGVGLAPPPPPPLPEMTHTPVVVPGGTVTAPPSRDGSVTGSGALPPPVGR